MDCYVEYKTVINWSMTIIYNEYANKMFSLLSTNDGLMTTNTKYKFVYIFAGGMDCSSIL